MCQWQKLKHSPSFIPVNSKLTENRQTLGWQAKCFPSFSKIVPGFWFFFCFFLKKVLFLFDFQLMLHTIGKTAHHREQKAQQNRSLFSASYTCTHQFTFWQSQQFQVTNKLWFTVIEQFKHGRRKITN